LAVRAGCLSVVDGSGTLHGLMMVAPMCRSYPPRVAIAIKRRGAKAHGWRNRLEPPTRLGSSAEVSVARVGDIDTSAQAQMRSALRPDTPRSM
jgi:hypothetical protein